MTRITRGDQTDIWRIRKSVARNPIWTVPNAPQASAPSKESHPPILGMIAMNEGQVKIERDREWYVVPDLLKLVAMLE